MPICYWISSFKNVILDKYRSKIVRALHVKNEVYRIPVTTGEVMKNRVKVVFKKIIFSWLDPSKIGYNNV